MHFFGLYAGLCWEAYFDDFPLVCNIANRQSTLSIALGIFELRGFAYSNEKLESFSKVAAMLGVELDLQGAADGLVRVQNKASGGLRLHQRNLGMWLHRCEQAAILSGEVAIRWGRIDFATSFL